MWGRRTWRKGQPPPRPEVHPGVRLLETREEVLAAIEEARRRERVLAQRLVRHEERYRRYGGDDQT